MGFLDALRQRRAEKHARSWGKWCARTMLLSALASKHHYKGVAPTYAWLAGKALLTRNHWRQVSETGFLFDKTGDEITISDDMNLLQVIHLVITVEYGNELIHLPSWRREELVRLADNEADRFITAG